MASPLDKETIEYCDRYLKATIRNIRCDHFVHLVKPSKYNLTFVNLDQFENELASEKTEPENSLCEYIDVPGAQIPIHDPEIYHALMSLSPMQRSILLQNIILKKTIKELSIQFHTTERKIKYQKHLALEELKRRISSEK